MNSKHESQSNSEWDRFLKVSNRSYIMTVNMFCDFGSAGRPITKNLIRSIQEK